MKQATILLSAMILPLAAFGQSDPSGKTLAATMDVFVFPAEGQDSSQQSKDEATCYEWAVGNTGSDPFNLEPLRVQCADDARADRRSSKRKHRLQLTRNSAKRRPRSNSQTLRKRSASAWKQMNTWSSTDPMKMGETQ
jgi:hypothetical protein